MITSAGPSDTMTTYTSAGPSMTTSAGPSMTTSAGPNTPLSFKKPVVANVSLSNLVTLEGKSNYQV